MTLALPPANPTPRQVAQVVNEILKGKINSVGEVTLTANAASTTVSDIKTGTESVILLMPQTANAAAALATTYIDPANYVDKLTFEITHANNAQTDKTFSYAILGSIVGTRQST